MKRLHLIRHAKSSWDHRPLIDLKRPLNKRGNNASKLMAPAIVDAGCHFENVFASPAVRAQETIQNMALTLPDLKVEWITDDALYTFNADDLMDWCRALSDELDEVTIVGHNPAITDITTRLTGTHILNVPTCGYIQMEFEGSWSKLSKNSAKFNTFLTPKMLKEE